MGDAFVGTVRVGYLRGRQDLAVGRHAPQVCANSPKWGALSRARFSRVSGLTMQQVSASENATAETRKAFESATNCVESFYDAWNRGSIDDMMLCIADDAEYEDAIFPSPFKGKAQVQQLFEKIMKLFPQNAEFMVDSIADGGKAAGCKWHVELNGKPLPFSRGNSFYEFDDAFRIRRAFETPEPFIKNGNVVLGLLSVVTKLLRL
ncbi:hypothetical protein FVE85_5491 [Porphyridium purpureum]|uniref:SnoaL-like domain-containing protein n=1 Tax=Porphyridium purpureum TaxID=35688 RepID=A0A5J4Z2P9_PORPP|nr:hypothetical protein FVE85_5491 [Porphyridium purpureum]|eukprot:POR3461..scf295_1